MERDTWLMLVQSCQKSKGIEGNSGSPGPLHPGPPPTKAITCEEYSGDLKSTLVWILNVGVANGLNFEWDLKSRSPTICNPDKWPPFCLKPFEIWTKMSGF